MAMGKRTSQQARSGFRPPSCRSRRAIYVRLNAILDGAGFDRFAEEIDLTFGAFGDLAGKIVLHLGCGSGIYSVEALKRGASYVTAVDRAAGMLALLRRRLLESGPRRSVHSHRGVPGRGAPEGRSRDRDGHHGLR
jgi:16S rRNA G966 N2-methylase RsmD